MKASFYLINGPGEGDYTGLFDDEIEVLGIPHIGDIVAIDGRVESGCLETFYRVKQVTWNIDATGNYAEHMLSIAVFVAETGEGERIYN